jgi:glycosyltransferase involved in cell wall biosynthesis
MSSLYKPGRVSIIMPVYNGQRYIERALLSIVTQDYDNLELIVINDGSTDNTVEIAESILECSDIDWIIYDTSGPSAYTPMTLGYAFLSGIARSAGEYFTIHSYDNISLPGRFSKLMSILRLLGNDNDSPYGKEIHMGAAGDCNTNLTTYAATEGMDSMTRVLTDTAIMRKDYYMRQRAYIPLLINGGWDDELGIILAIFSLGDIVRTEEPLYLFRVGVENNLALNWDQRLEVIMAEQGYNMNEIRAGRYSYSQDRAPYYFSVIIGRRLGE